MSLAAQVAMSSPRLALLIAAAAMATLAPLATAFTPGPWYTGRATRYGSPGEGSPASACILPSGRLVDPPAPSPQFKSIFEFATVGPETLLAALFQQQPATHCSPVKGRWDSDAPTPAARTSAAAAAMGLRLSSDTCPLQHLRRRSLDHPQRPLR